MAVQQQIPNNVVFTSPMTMATLTGVSPQQQQQTGSGTQQPLMVTQNGQAIAPQFSNTYQPNTQPLLQAPNMGVINGLSPVHVIGANGQPYFSQFYTQQMQPMLVNNLMTIPQNNGQGISLQLQAGSTNGNTLIAGQTSNTPGKNQPTIVKGVSSISPQQQPRQNTNSNKNNQSPSQQQTLIQAQNNNPIIIGIPQTGNGSITIPNANSTNARKSKISTQQILTPAAYKSSPTFNAAANSNTTQNGQTIMVHGQNIPHGTSGIQLANNQQIFSPMASFQTIQPNHITWQQPTQLVTQNGQILLRTQNQNESPQMFIQTGNNQFQAVPVQVAQSPQTPNANNSGMQVHNNGQQMMSSPITQNMPISISNQNLGIPNQMVSPHKNKQIVVSSANPPNVTQTSMGQITQIIPRQRPLRPANQQAAAQNTPPTANNNKPKNMEIGTAIKLAPKSPIGIKNTIMKIPLPPLQKTNEIATQVSSMSLNNNIINNNSNSNNENRIVSLNVPATSSSSLTTTINIVTGTKSDLSKVKKLTSTTTIVTSTSTINTSTNTTNTNINTIICTSASTEQQNKSTSVSSSVNSVKSNLRSASATKLNGIQSSPSSSAQSVNTVNKDNSTMTSGILKSPNLPLPKSNEKTDILTHVVDGYVIQESGNPFPVNNYVPTKDYINSINQDLCNICNKNKRVENPQKKRWKNCCQNCVENLNAPPPNRIGQSTSIDLVNDSTEENNSQSSDLPTPNGVVTSNTAAAVTTASPSPSSSSSSLCSSSSSTTLKRTMNQVVKTNNNNSLTKRIKPKNMLPTINDHANMNGNGNKEMENPEDEWDIWMPENAPDLKKWTVDQVSEFISHLDGCADLAEGFRTQEIDGHALLLIKQEHIIDILNTKLGPALKIIRSINILKKRLKRIKINNSNCNENNTNFNENITDNNNSQ